MFICVDELGNFPVSEAVILKGLRRHVETNFSKGLPKYIMIISYVYLVYTCMARGHS